MTTLQNILDLKELQELKIVAGMNGMFTPVTTVTVMEIPDVNLWTKGGELIITSLYSIGSDKTKQCNLVTDLIHNGCSGLAIKVGQYSNPISQSAINIANAHDFTIIEIPHDMSYVDFIMPSMNLLLTNKNMDEFREKFIHDLLFGTYTSTEKILERGLALNFNLQSHYFQSIILYSTDNDTEKASLSPNQLRFLIASASAYANKLNDVYSCPWLILKNKGILIVESFAPSESAVHQICEELIRLNHFHSKSNSFKIAIGSVETGVNAVKSSYGNATEAYKTGSILYHDIPIYNHPHMDLICSISQIIKSNCDTLKIFVERLSNIEFIDTLIQYYQCNENLDETAAALFIHKNTLKYRLQKIAEQSGLDYRKPNDNFLLHFIVLSIILQQEPH